MFVCYFLSNLELSVQCHARIFFLVLLKRMLPRAHGVKKTPQVCSLQSHSEDHRQPMVSMEGDRNKIRTDLTAVPFIEHRVPNVPPGLISVWLNHMKRVCGLTYFGVIIINELGNSIFTPSQRCDAIVSDG